MAANFRFSRGTFVADVVTGVSGCIVSRLDSLTGCNRYCVQPPADKDGKYVGEVWVDEHSLVIDPSKTRLQLPRDAEQPPG